jgi:probable F420-dependent oxidoreductase
MGQPAFGVAVPATGPVSAGTSFGDVVDAIEDLGYADVWFGDHVAVPGYASHIVEAEWLEPLVCCASALARTSRVRVGTDVLVAPYRHPVLVAKMAATLDALSGGRFVLGAGVGYLKGEFEALGADYERRGAVSDEYLAAMRALWESAGNPTSYAGQAVRFEDVAVGPAPVSGRLPIWVGGNGPSALRRAAIVGDGWHPLFPTPNAYRLGRDRISALRTRSDPFTFSMSLASTRVVERGVNFSPVSWADTVDVPEDFSYAPPLPTDTDGRVLFVGDPDQVASDVAVYIAAGVEHFTLRFSAGGGDSSVGDFVQQLERFARDVMARFDPLERDAEEEHR